MSTAENTLDWNTRSITLNGQAMKTLPGAIGVLRRYAESHEITIEHDWDACFTNSMVVTAPQLVEIRAQVKAEAARIMGQPAAPTGRRCPQCHRSVADGAQFDSVRTVCNDCA